MATFNLTIVTPDKEAYNGEAERIIARTTEGDVGILAGHCDYVAALQISPIKIKLPDGVKYAAIGEGFLSVANGKVTIVTSSFEWAEDIDLERAEKAKEAAESRLNQQGLTNAQIDHAEVKLKRAMNREKVKNQYSK